jgi:NitT/TauT family transport system permease protein
MSALRRVAAALPEGMLHKMEAGAVQSMVDNVQPSSFDRAASRTSAAQASFPGARHKNLLSDPGVRERALNVLMPLGAIVAFLAIWAAAVSVFRIPDYLLPAPQDVFFRIIQDWPILLKNSWSTLGSVLTGFLASGLIGVPIAFAIVLSRTVERMLMPILVMSQTIPKVAIAPILVVWLGFGILPKIAVVFMISFFPIVVSTVVGLKSVESEMVDLVRSMGANTAKIMLRVRAPSALPQIFAGFKIAICLSVVGAIVGEFVGSDSGLGYLLLTSTGSLDGPLVWSALFILIAIGMTLFMIVAKVERLMIPWHVSIRAEETAVYQA